MTGIHEDAEDITQETFIRVCQHIDQFRGDSQLFTWIYTIAKNLCCQLLKKQKVNNFAALEFLLHSNCDQGTTETFSDREKQFLLNQIKEGCFTGLLRCLSFYQRMAFILYVILNLPVKDVANILEKSEGAVKVLVHRARHNLKGFLCRNCSLYDLNNDCRCENLMSFSLDKGWIKRLDGNHVEEASFITPQTIGVGIEGIRKVTELYKTLIDHAPPDDLVKRIQDVI